MYLWIGIDVDSEFKELKRKVEKAYNEMNYDNVVVNL